MDDCRDLPRKNQVPGAVQVHKTLKRTYAAERVMLSTFADVGESKLNIAEIHGQVENVAP